MAATIITVAQQKGGAGKTTIAAQLAVAIASEGFEVAVLDIDPQASLAGWHRVREGNGTATDPISLSAVAGWRVNTEVDKLKRRFDYVIIDSPPHAETETKHALNVADLALIPVQPSPMDLWATDATLDAAGKERTKAMVVLNRVPPRSKVAELIRGEIDAMGLLQAKTHLGNRTAYAASMLAGRGVTESDPRSAAAGEVRALLKEIRRHLRENT